MSANQQFKQYIRKLQSSGLETCAAQLSKLEGMGRVGAFQWFCANKLDKPKAQPKQASWIDELDDTEDEPEVGVNPFEDEDYDVRVNKAAAKLAEMMQPVKDKPKAARKPRTRKPAPVHEDVKTYRWNQGVWKRYGIKPKIGTTFKSKAGHTHTVIEVAADHVLSAR